MAREAGSGLRRAELKPYQGRARLFLVLGAWQGIEKAVGWRGGLFSDPVHEGGDQEAGPGRRNGLRKRV